MSSQPSVFSNELLQRALCGPSSRPPVCIGSIYGTGMLLIPTDLSAVVPLLPPVANDK